MSARKISIRNRKGWDVVTLAGPTAWRAFVRDNEDALLEEYPSLSAARALAEKGKLKLGGGAAPMVRVRFKKTRKRRRARLQRNPSAKRKRTIARRRPRLRQLYVVAAISKSGDVGFLSKAGAVSTSPRSRAHRFALSEAQSACRSAVKRGARLCRIFPA